MAKRSRQDVRRAIHSRIRKKVRGNGSRPRLAVFRSVNHIYAQLINDDEGVTICSASTVEKSASVGNGGNIDAAKAVGRLIAERAKGKGLNQVVFDRGGYIYHGRVKALAEAAREAGLQF
jgi:large subunit ribosomal protein L18